MEVIKIREDKLNSATWYKCDCCNKMPQNNDVIITTEINYEDITVCSEECLMKYLKEEDILKRKKITTYEKSNRDILKDKIESIKPNSKMVLDSGAEVQYFNIEGMYNHYVVKYRCSARVFGTVHEVLNYLLK